MRSSEQPGQLVMPLQTPHKTPQRKGSTDSVGSSSVKRSLSFTPDSAKQQPEPKAEEQQQVAEQPKPEPKAEEKQVTSESPTEALPEAGSLTILGHSAEERFRITYEARQLLRKVFASPETPIVGSVGRGLLVVPGQWARLSNISEDGKWLRTETFRIGSKEVVHTKGASAGRALEAYRKVRKSHPELVAQLDIMSQPASNVDSVILSWVIEGQASGHPCSMWQRDCFSSVVADSAVQSMAAAQQVSCLVAAKCTSKLQITDSDFAKAAQSLGQEEAPCPQARLSACSEEHILSVQGGRS